MESTPSSHDATLQLVCACVCMCVCMCVVCTVLVSRQFTEHQDKLTYDILPREVRHHWEGYKQWLEEENMSPVTIPLTMVVTCTLQYTKYTYAQAMHLIMTVFLWALWWWCRHVLTTMKMVVSWRCTRRENVFTENLLHHTASLVALYRKCFLQNLH